MNTTEIVIYFFCLAMYGAFVCMVTHGFTKVAYYRRGYEQARYEQEAFGKFMDPKQ